MLTFAVHRVVKGARNSYEIIKAVAPSIDQAEVEGPTTLQV